MGFQEVQFDYVRFPDEPRERMATAIFPAPPGGQTQRQAVRDTRRAAEKTGCGRSGFPSRFDIFGLTGLGGPAAIWASGRSGKIS